MNPEFIDGMSWEMAEVYGAITDQILINLAHYFRFYKPGVPVPKSSFEYQANMLAQMGQVNKDTVRIIRNGLAGADDALKSTLEQAIIDSVRKAQPELLEAVKKGILSPAGRPVVAPSQMRAFQLYYQQASDKLNMVNTVMLESTQSAYQQCVSDVVAEMSIADGMNRIQTAIDTAAGETVTGVSSWNQALKHATDRMKESGIVGFIDHAGRRWSAEAYTAMDIRTTVANTARAAVWETNQDFGNDLYQVSYHNGARPLCYPWQNKVISSIDAARTVVDLDGNEIEVIAQSATSYGQPAGLFGINCKHYPTPFIPGVSITRGQPQDEETNERTYAESQEQRRLERKLREEKRDVMMAKAQGADPEEIKRLQDKAQRSSQEIQDFCDRTGRARHKDREAVYTKRDFPDKDKYNVAEFERKQKETIDKYFGGGGSQQGYTFGQMNQTVSTTPIAETTTPNVRQMAQLNGQEVNTTPPAQKAAQTGLTEDQRSAIESYVSGENMYINQVLRGRMERTAADDELIKDLDGALNKPIGKTQILYRSVDAEAVFGKMSAIDYDNLRGNLVYNDNSPIVKHTADRFISKTNGKTIPEKGYLSTTTDYGVAKEWGGYTGSEKPIVLKLNTPGSTHGLALTDFEVEEEAQREVLLARGQSYKVNRIVGEDGNIVVYADILE